MTGIFWEFLCWLDGGHFPRRKPFIVNDKWRTLIQCRCGMLRVVVDGLPEHPYIR